MNLFKTNFKTIISWGLDYVNKGHQRSVKAKKNIIATFFIKGLSILTSLVLVPLTIHYVNPTQYGIWLTLSSIVAWFSFFDIGFGHGLRNKFAEAVAKGQYKLARIYVSTTYAVLSLIVVGLLLIFYLVNPLINWSAILNSPPEMAGELGLLAMIVFTFFCLQFVLNLINIIITAVQEPAKASLLNLLSSVLSLSAIYILTRTTSGSLIYLGICYGFAPVAVLLISSLWLYRKQYRKFAPSFFYVKFSYAKNLMNLGLVFFIIQIAYVIQYQTANIIIAQSFSHVDVTAYNIVYKYFGVLNMLAAIFFAPLWSASTEAYVKNDMAWIKNSIKKYNYFNIVLFGLGLIMLIFSKPVFDLWLGKGTVDIDFSLSLWGFIFFNLSIFGSKYVSFLNGISALRLQFWACLLSPVVFGLTALVLIKYYQLGVYSVFIAGVVADFNAFFLAPFQYFQIIYKKKKGIWIR